MMMMIKGDKIKLLENRKEDLERDLKRLAEIKNNSTHFGFRSVENAIEEEIEERKFFLNQITYELNELVNGTTDKYK